jgi:hypothetical protein
VSLVAREVEQAGIPTATIVNFRPHAECARPPRALFVNYPYGSQWGPPNNTKAHRRLATDALNMLEGNSEPGTILDVPYSWADVRRE